MHGSVLGFFSYGALQAMEVAGKDVLEVGSLNVNGTIRPMVEARHPRQYLGVDVVSGPGVDAVVDVENLTSTFGEESFDVVISTEMMEHTADWQAAIINMVEVLRPGGVLLITTRSPGFAYHHPPDRWRYTQQAFSEIIHGVGLDPAVIMDDPEYPGVFVKAYKPEAWIQLDKYWLDDVQGVTPVLEPLKLLGLPYNPDGCGYYRFWQPWGELARSSGHLALCPPVGHHDWAPNEDEAREFDMIARQRPTGEKHLRDWKRWVGKTALVYEVDDNIFQPDSSGLPNWMDEDRQRTALECVRMSDLVTVSTPPLADVMRIHNYNVTVVPNFIHQDALSIIRPQREKLTLNWAGGLTHLQDLMLIQAPLQNVLETERGLDMHFIGWDCSPVIKQGRFTPWQVDVWDYYKSIDGDIGLIPLVDTLFNQCRSAIKALEYAALGIPVIASDVEPYREFVRHGETGYLVNSADEWRTRLRELIHDDYAREEMGRKAKNVAAEWTIQGNWQRWAKAYETVVSITKAGGQP